MDKSKELIAELLGKARSSALWFVLPSLVVVTAIGVTIVGYEPLMFDPSLYQAKQALASELDAADDPGQDKEDKPKTLSASDSDGSQQLTDGTWTGYAVCGQGNAHGWQPYYVAVTIQVKDNKVAGITDIVGSATGGEGSESLAWNSAESGKYLDLAINGQAGDGIKAQMDGQIAAEGKVASIDVVSGATFSSQAIYNAYADAVAKAGGQAAPQAVAPETAPEQAASGEPAQVSVAPTSSSAAYADGDFTGYAICGEGNPDGWSPYYVGVTVRVAGGKPTGITRIWGSATGDAGSRALAWNASESGRYLEWAIGGKGSFAGVQAQINGQLAAAGSVSGVDTVSGATFSSRAVAEAYGAALSKAAQAAGSAASTEPTTPPAHDPQKPSSDKPDSQGGEDEKPQQVDPSNGDEDVSAAKFADGTWTGYAVCGEGNEDGWSPYYVAVTVQVKGGVVKKIKDVEGAAQADEGSAKLSWNADESQRYLDWAALGRTKRGVTYKGVLDQAREAIKSGAALGSIDVVSGATFSSNAIVKAYYAALKKSAAAAGSTYEEPEPEPGNDDQIDQEGPEDQGDKDDDQSSQEGKDDGQNDAGQQDVQEGEGDNGSGDANAGEDGESEQRPALIDGDYTGHGKCEDPTYEDDWDPYYVLVSIEVRDGSVVRVSDIRGDSEGEVDRNVRFDLSNATYLNWAIKGTARAKGLLEQIQAKLDASQDASKVDVVSGATFSSNAIIEGYTNAVAQAGGLE